MLANSTDDARAIADVVKFFADEKNLPEIAGRQKDGLPPPLPRTSDGKTAIKYEIKLDKNSKSVVTYRWVEIGPKALWHLNLDPANAAKTDKARSLSWKEARVARDMGKATTLTEKLSGHTPGDFNLRPYSARGPVP